MEYIHIAGMYGTSFHAGPKAQRDVTEIFNCQGWRPFKVVRPSSRTFIGRLLSCFLWFFKCKFLRMKLPKNALVFMQYPSAAYSRIETASVITKKVKDDHKICLVILVHDIASLRVAGAKIYETLFSEEEQNLFSIADKIVVHNERMKEVLVQQGIAVEKILVLGIFDYLIPNGSIVNNRCKSLNVVIAGNLDVNKVQYIKFLHEIKDVHWNLYGINFSAERMLGDNFTYKGAFSPEDLPQQLEGSFGLVWDGDSIDSCTGAFGEYTRINNPHKLSLYLSAGMPVIVWSKAAIAEFVKEYNCGIIVDSLYDVPQKINLLSFQEYKKMHENSILISKKLCSGYFTKRIAKRIKNL